MVPSFNLLTTLISPWWKSINFCTRYNPMPSPGRLPVATQRDNFGNSGQSCCSIPTAWSAMDIDTTPFLPGPHFVRGSLASNVIALAIKLKTDIEVKVSLNLVDWPDIPCSSTPLI